MESSAENEAAATYFNQHMEEVYQDYILTHQIEVSYIFNALQYYFSAFNFISYENFHFLDLTVFSNLSPLQKCKIQVSINIAVKSLEE